MYAFVQKSEADRQREVTEQIRALAIKNEKKAAELIKKYEALLKEKSTRNP